MQSEPKRVLVVDDDDAIRTLLFTVLRRRGIAVDVAHNGDEALERCAACHYSVLLLDLMMPRKNGYEVLKELQSLDECERPMVLVLTAGNTPSELDPTLVAGMIRKPFDIQLLVDTVSGCLAMSAPRVQPLDCPSPDSEAGRGKSSAN